MAFSFRSRPESVVSLHVRGDGVAVERLFRENRAGSYF